MEWPTGRCGHAATCVSRPLLVIVGGRSDDDDDDAIRDCWIHDLTEEGKMCCTCVSDTVCLVLVFSYHSLTL